METVIESGKSIGESIVDLSSICEMVGKQPNDRSSFDWEWHGSVD